MNSPFVILFAVIALGAAVGALRWRGFSLGAGGVFFVALLFGHFQFEIPHHLTELGLALFVYAVGLQAGPRFLPTLRERGVEFLAVAGGTALVGGLATVALAQWLQLSPALAAGMYTGATTCTPALAAVLDALRAVSADAQAQTAVGYGATYPFTVAFLVLLVQLLPRLTRTPAGTAAAQFAAAQEAHAPPLESCAFRITNPNCTSLTVGEFHQLRMTTAVLSRVKNAGAVQPARPETPLRLGDVVLAVGTPDELAKLETLLGDIVVEPMQDPSGRLVAEQVLVSRPQAFGRSLRQLGVWERFGVVVTRVRRDGMELRPSGDLRLDPGDVLRVVGPRLDVDALIRELGREERRLNETSLIPFAAGLALGALLGLVPLPIPGGVEVRLGLGGGTFLVALLLGHLGGTGPVRLYVPAAVKHFTRELGLLIFLAGAGAAAGQRFVPILTESGPGLILAGAGVTITCAATACLLAYRVLRWNLLYGAGALSACMTNPPALAAAQGLTDSEAASVGFAGVYPLALLAKILVAPLVYLLLAG